VQNALPLVAPLLAQVADTAVGLVDQDQRFCVDAARGIRAAGVKFLHGWMIAARETSAPRESPADGARSAPSLRATFRVNATAAKPLIQGSARFA
jgi:hypothetical protein